ncbi:unnamed protein product, partial [Ectocarpus sp. 6 AP-2014]
KADNAAPLVKSTSSVYLVFRETVSRTNWRQNLKWARHGGFRISADGPDGEVHTGFFEAQDSLWSTLQTLLWTRDRPHPQRTAYMAGHSLGGAMAIITAARLVGERRVERIGGVYTFGGPAVFDSEVARQYSEHPVLKGRTFRLKFKRDPVVNAVAAQRYLSPGVSIRLTERDG